MGPASPLRDRLAWDADTMPCTANVKGTHGGAAVGIVFLASGARLGGPPTAVYGLDVGTSGADDAVARLGSPQHIADRCLRILICGVKRATSASMGQLCGTLAPLVLRSTTPT